MLGAGAHALVKNVPVPKATITCEIQLAGKKAADRHADFFEVSAAIRSAFTSGGQCLDPIGVKLFIGRNQPLKIFAIKRTGHYPPGLACECSGPETCYLEKIATRRAQSGLVDATHTTGTADPLARTVQSSVVVS